MSECSFNVQFKECGISFVVPISKMLCDTHGLVKTVEKMFASLRDSTKKHEDKVEYDRMRALLEYANSHGATWCELKPTNVSTVVTLYFTDTKSMVAFEEGVEEAVENIAMK